jgi:hypothetical protein
MSQVDWSKAPEWANAVVMAPCRYQYYVEAWGVNSKRQHLGNSRPDDVGADMSSDGHSWTLVAERQLPWTGEGLPPVGTRACVYDPEGLLMYGAGEQGEVIAHVENTAVIRMSYGLGCFTAKHLRTPEQIAAEERDEGIRAIQKASGGDGLPPITYTHAAKLYDAGVRMPSEGKKP